MCSMPVCQACIIKASFGKRDKDTFPNRRRSLGVECFNSGNPHREISLNCEEGFIRTYYLMRTECVCTAKDGHLCLRCKTKQNSKLYSGNKQCYGIGCSRLEQDSFGGRVCLWCDLPLPRERSRAESRRNNDSRHLLARRHSSCDQSPEEEAEDDIIDNAEPEAIGIPSCFTSPAPESTPSPRKAIVVIYDPFGNTRRREVERVS